MMHGAQRMTSRARAPAPAATGWPSPLRPVLAFLPPLLGRRAIYVVRVLGFGPRRAAFSRTCASVDAGHTHTGRRAPRTDVAVGRAKPVRCGDGGFRARALRARPCWCCRSLVFLAGAKAYPLRAGRSFGDTAGTKRKIVWSLSWSAESNTSMKKLHRCVSVIG